MLRRELAEYRSGGSVVICGKLAEGDDSIATGIMNSEGCAVAALSIVVGEETSIRAEAWERPGLVAAGGAQGRGAGGDAELAVTPLEVGAVPMGGGRPAPPRSARARRCRPG